MKYTQNMRDLTIGKMLMDTKEQNEPQPAKKDMRWKKICGAKLRNKDAYCKKAALKGTTRCRQHGGLSPSGMQHWRLRDGVSSGRYSKALPRDMLEKYTEARTDPELLSLRDELALTDTRLAHLLENLDTGVQAQAWREMHALWRQFLRAQQAKDTGTMRLVLNRLGERIEASAQEENTWREINECVERRRKLVETEQRRLVNMSQVLTYERAAVLFGYITGVIQRHVTDRDTLAAISAEFRAISLTDGSESSRSGFQFAETTG